MDSTLTYKLKDLTPLISIIVPFYNAEAFIELTIKSVLAQTYSNWELLLFDDGSTDNSLMIVKSFTDSRLKIFSDGHNYGRPRRLNDGIQVAKGEFIARLDADDAFFPNKIELQLAYFQKYPDTDVLGTFAIAFNNNNELIGMIKRTVPDTFKQVVITGSCFIHPSVMARSLWFRKHLYNEEINRSDDFELWVRTYQKSVFRCLDQPLLFYRNTGVMPKWKYRDGYNDVKHTITLHKNIIKWNVSNVAVFRAYCKVQFYTLFVKFGMLNKIHPLTLDEQKKSLSILDIINDTYELLSFR